MNELWNSCALPRNPGIRLYVILYRIHFLFHVHFLFIFFLMHSVYRKYVYFHPPPPYPRKTNLTLDRILRFISLNVLVFSVFLFTSETWTVLCELHRKKMAALEVCCWRRIAKCVSWTEKGTNWLDSDGGYLHHNNCPYTDIKITS